MKRVSHSHKLQAASGKQSEWEWISEVTTDSLRLVACGLPLKARSSAGFTSSFQLLASSPGGTQWVF